MNNMPKLYSVLVVIAVVLVGVVAWTMAPLASMMPQIQVVMPTAAPLATAIVAGSDEASAVATLVPEVSTVTPSPTVTATATATITPSPTITVTPSPTAYVVQYSAIVRQVKGIAELNTKEVLIDVVVTYDAERDGLTALWDKGDFLSVKSTYRVKAGIDWKAVNVNIGTNNTVTVTFNPARISSIDELEELSEVNYYKKGIRAIFAESDTVNSNRLKQARIDLEQKARQRICEMVIVDDAADDAKAYVKSFILQLNPLLNADDVQVVIGVDQECR